jgi:hypothetical protein
MTKGLGETQAAYKIWKNSSSSEESVSFLGDYHPPKGQFFFTAKDLRALGFGPGEYTVLAPEGSRHEIFSKWQTVTVPND